SSGRSPLWSSLAARTRSHGSHEPPEAGRAAPDDERRHRRGNGQRERETTGERDEREGRADRRIAYEGGIEGAFVRPCRKDEEHARVRPRERLRGDERVEVREGGGR